MTDGVKVVPRAVPWPFEHRLAGQFTILQDSRDRGEIVLRLENELAVLERGARSRVVGFETVIERAVQARTRPGDVEAKWHRRPVVQQSRIPTSIDGGIRSS